jgi:iduronate 2-sulfatase
MGKIFHRGHDTGDDDPLSWTKPYFHGVGNWEDGQNSWKAVPDNMLKDKPLQDKQVADLAVSTLRKLAPKAKSGEKPFFLAVGFQKPHLPFVFPKSFIDHYPMSTIHLPNNPHAPKHMPPVAWANYGELRSRYHDINSVKIRFGP